MKSCHPQVMVLISSVTLSQSGYIIQRQNGVNYQKSCLRISQGRHFVQQPLRCLYSSWYTTLFYLYLSSLRLKPQINIFYKQKRTENTEFQLILSRSLDFVIQKGFLLVNLTLSLLNKVFQVHLSLNLSY